jgi:hypothetical protein
MHFSFEFYILLNYTKSVGDTSAFYHWIVFDKDLIEMLLIYSIKMSLDGEFLIIIQVNNRVFYVNVLIILFDLSCIFSAKTN